MKRLFSLLLAVCMVVSLCAASAGAEQTGNLTQDVLVLFTSDVHCGVEQGFGYAGLQAVKDSAVAAGNHVLLVDDGDAIQGESIGLLTRGQAMIELMNGMKYDVVIPGNHEFDYGMERFCDKCVAAGIDGMILPDVPFEEKEEFAPACRARGLSFISLIAPTSENRVAMIAKEADGFLYIVSSMGVTGVRSEITTDIGGMVKLVRENTAIPCAVGFGISTPAQAKKMADLSDGAIVGSAIVKLIAEHGKDAPESVYSYVKSMKDGMGA